jgi:hypothetical protein
MVIDLLKLEIRSSQEEPENAEPRLIIKKVDVSLALGKFDVISGGLSSETKVLGFEIGGSADISRTSQKEQRLLLHLVPSQELQVAAPSSLGLSEAIMSIKDAIRHAANSPPSFIIPCSQYEVNFNVEKISETQARFVILKGDRKTSESSLHKMTIQIVMPENENAC